MRQLLVAALVLIAVACAPSDVAVEEAGRAKVATQPPSTAPEPAAPQDLGEGLLLTVLERGTGAFVRAGGKVRVHYRARVVSISSPATPEAETASPADETPADETVAQDGEAVAATGDADPQTQDPSEPDAAAEPSSAPDLPLYFDSSRQRGVPDVWDLSSTASPRLIEGIRRGLVGLTAGSRVTLFIPAELAWADEGLAAARVPPNADVLYEIELLEVLP